MLLYVACAIFALQDVPGNPEGVLVDGIKTELCKQARKDLSRVQRLTGLADADLRGVMTAIDDPAKEAARRYAWQAAEGLSRPAVLSPLLARVIETELRTHIGVDTSRRYATDVIERRRLWKAAMVRGCVVMIDRRVGLTQKQFREVAEVLENQWPLSQQYNLGRMTRDLWAFDRHGKPGVLPVGFPTSAVYTLLSASQKRAWDSRIDTLQKRDTPSWLIQLPERKPESVREIALFLNHHALVLSDQLKLDDKQRHRLTLAAKGAARSAHEARRAAIAAFAAEQQSPEHWEVVDTTLPDLAVCHSDWVTLVRRVLKGESLERFDNLTNARNRAIHEAVAHVTAAQLTERCDLLAVEQRALYKLLAEGNVDPRGAWRSHQRYSQWCGLSNPRLAESFTGSQLQGIQAWLDRMSRGVLRRERSRD